MRKEAGMRFAKLWAGSAVALALGAGASMAETGGHAVPWQMGLQPGVTPVAEYIHWFHNYLLLPIITVITLFVLGLLIYVMVKFNAKAHPVPSKTTHNTLVEVLWTVIPIVIVLGFAIYGAVALGRNEAVAKDRLVVDVQGQQFAWTFTYPSYGNLKTGILALPVGRQVEFHITAVEHDVLHSFYIPAFRLKQDAVPGVPQKMIATPDRIGTYMVTCAELCGIGHAQMRTVLHVMSPANFTAWIAAQKKAASQPAGGGNTDPAALFSSNCASCHTFQAANATGTVGPDLDNLAADASKFGGGESPEDYVKESITDPDKVVVSGFPAGVMPSTFGSSLTPAQIGALVKYLLKGGS